MENNISGSVFVVWPLKTFEKEHLSQLSNECSLLDMLVYDDTDHDNHLDLNEFYAAFSKLYSKSRPILSVGSFICLLVDDRAAAAVDGAAWLDAAQLVAACPIQLSSFKPIALISFELMSNCWDQFGSGNSTIGDRLRPDGCQIKSALKRNCETLIYPIGWRDKKRNISTQKEEERKQGRERKSIDNGCFRPPSIVATRRELQTTR